MLNTEEDVNRWLTNQLFPSLPPPPAPKIKASDLLSGKVLAGNDGELGTMKIVLELVVRWFKNEKHVVLPDDKIRSEAIALWDSGWIIPYATSVMKDGEEALHVIPLIWDGFSYAEPGRQYGVEHERGICEPEQGHGAIA